LSVDFKAPHPLHARAPYEEFVQIASGYQRVLQDDALVTRSPMNVEAFRAILEDVLEEENLVITESTEARDVPSWDSLNHVRLLVHIEQAYGVNFPVDAVERLQNVGELITLVNRLMDQEAGR
jgi:acyl carrier protein